MSPVMHRSVLVVTVLTLVLAATLAPATQTGDKGARVDAQGDTLPEGALARIGGVRLRHNGEIGLVAFAPDGKSLFSLGADQTFRRWDVEDGKELARFEKKGTMLYMSAQAAARLGGARMVGGGMLMVKGGMVVDFYDGNGQAAPASHSADGKLLAVLDNRNCAVVLETATGKTYRKMDLREPQGHLLAMSLDGKLLAVTEFSGEDNYVRMWDLTTDKELPQLKLGRQRMVTKLQFSHDGKLLAGLSGAQIRVWDVTTGKRIRLYEGHENQIMGIAFSHDGKYLASAAADGSLRVWETESEEEVKKLNRNDQAFTSVEFSPDGKFIIAGCADRNICVFSWVTEKEVVLEGHEMPVMALAVSPDSKLLASADGGGAIRLWDLETCKEKAAVKQPDRLHSFGAYDGGRTVALWTATGKIRHLDTLTGMEHDSVPLPKEENMAVEVSPDGRLGVILNRGDEEGFVIWDGVKGKELFKVAGHPGGTNAAGFSPDSKMIVTSGGDGTVRLWKATTGKEVLQIANVNGFGVTFSPDGKLVAVMVEDSLCLYETATGNERCRMKMPNLDPQCLCFSPDSKLLIVSNSDEVLRVWDAVEGKLLRGLIGHQGRVQTVAFAPKGDMVASGGSDGTVRLWKVQSGEELRSFEGHQGNVLHLAFSDDGRFVISSGSDNCILVWDATSRVAAKPRDNPGKRMDQFWADLLHEDGAIFAKAMAEMIGTPKETVKFLDGKLHPVPVVPAAIIQELIRELDHKTFAARQKATKELEKLEGQARIELEKVVAKPPSPEVQTRVKKLLDKLDSPLVAPDDVRTLRAVEILERIGTNDARDLLRRLSRGAPGARLTTEAGESLARLSR
jgi:WD40 repeat protein